MTKIIAQDGRESHHTWQLVAAAESTNLWQTSLTAGIWQPSLPCRRSTGMSTRPEFLPPAWPHSTRSWDLQAQTNKDLHPQQPSSMKFFSSTLSPPVLRGQAGFGFVSALLGWTTCSHIFFFFSFLSLEGLSWSQLKSFERQPASLISFGSSPKYTPQPDMMADSISVSRKHLKIEIRRGKRASLCISHSGCSAGFNKFQKQHTCQELFSINK